MGIILYTIILGSLLNNQDDSWNPKPGPPFFVLTVVHVGIFETKQKLMNHPPKYRVLKRKMNFIWVVSNIFEV